jgi:pyruvate dehydrogenase E2 component (dihydrolipoamide acetyltransferase)
MATEFRLPELGENISSGTVTKIMVAVGDTVSVDQAVVEIETEKAVIEIPSTVAGAVKEIRAKVGKSINVGDVILVVEGGSKATAPAKPAPKPPQARPPEKPEPALPATSPAPARSAVSASPALASPSVRRLAHELGVDADKVQGSGSGGRVSAEDVRAFAAREQAVAPVEATHREEPPLAPADRDRWGAIERQPMSAIRRKTALHMSNAWQTIPHVTQFDRADITSIEAFRKQYGPRAEARGGRLTVTILLLKVLAAALRKFPRFNASVDMENQEVILKKYINIGVAVDTENGLLVPVVRDADKKSILDLCVETPHLAKKARARKLTLDEMSGGSFTITNLGGIGGTGFTPIINAPEVAILGVSRSRVEPVFVNGSFAPRTMLPLSLSYDHRVIDGAEAARFLRWVVEALEQPFVLLLEDTEASK